MSHATPSRITQGAACDGGGSSTKVPSAASASTVATDGGAMAPRPLPRRARSVRGARAVCCVPVDCATVQEAVQTVAVESGGACLGGIVQVAEGHHEVDHVTVGRPGVEIIGRSTCGKLPRIDQISLCASGIVLRHLLLGRVEVRGPAASPPKKGSMEEAEFVAQPISQVPRRPHGIRGRRSVQVRASSAPPCYGSREWASGLKISAVESCSFEPDDCARAAVAVDGASGFRIIGNSFRLPPAVGCGRLDGVDGVEIERSSDVCIAANSFVDGRDQVSITESYRVALSSNRFDGRRRHSVYIGVGSDVELGDNDFLGDAVFQPPHGSREDACPLDSFEEEGFN